MIMRWVRRSVASCVVAGVCCLLWPKPALAGGSTAKARPSAARAAAAQWQKDAVLVTVSTLQAAEDGTAPLHVGGVGLHLLFQEDQDMGRVLCDA
jgi:hypothetical protein